MYEIGEEVMYLDSQSDNPRIGIIEAINEQMVQICMLDGSLFIANVDCILYSLKY
jgi:hypothetical protein